VNWCRSLGEVPAGEPMLLLAHELFDALPVHQLKVRAPPPELGPYPWAAVVRRSVVTVAYAYSRDKDSNYDQITGNVRALGKGLLES